MLELKALLLTQGMHGMVSQTQGLANALKLNFKHKKIKFNSYSSRLHSRKSWTISWCIDCYEMD